MKKILSLFVGVTLTIITTTIVSCSDEKNTDSNPNATPKSLIKTTETVISEVPRNKLIYYTLGRDKNLSVNELINLYKKDVSESESHYLVNLKNMWLTILNSRVYDQGTEEQKLFLIKEQLALDNNLAHFSGFYNLLAISKLLSRSEKENIANTYYEKNLKSISNVQWPNPEDGKKKESELIYAKRNFTNIANTQK